MKILMLKDYFYPEKCAGINLSLELVSELTKKGFNIEIYTPIPCRGINDDIRFSYKKRKKELIYDAVVYRYWLPYEGKSTLIRALRYFLQNFIQIWKGFSTKYDLLFLGSTPPTMGLVGAVLKLIKHKPFIYNLQDVFPDSLVTTGITKKGSLLWVIGSIIEKITYSSADKIIVISESFKTNLINKNVPEEKIVVINNWIDTDTVHPVPKAKNSVYDEFDIPKGKYIILYAGNLGNAQGSDVILEAADLLSEYDDILFVVFGGGSQFEEFKLKAKHRANLLVFGLLPSERVSEVYSLGDIALITCKKGTGMSGMPSKTWSIMACNVPIVASFDTDSDLAKMLNQVGAGVCVEPENPECLSKAILKQYLNKNITKCNSREFIINNISKEYCTDAYIREFSRIINTRER